MRDADLNSEASPGGPPLTSHTFRIPWEKLILFLALVAIFIFFTLAGPPGFARMGNFETIARQTAIVGTAALGMTVIIISGGIDLSVGSIVALVTVVIAALLQAGVSPATAALGGIAVGAACGLFNGLIITWVRVVPFIVTLGSLLIFRGAAKGIAREQTVNAPITWLEELLAALRAEHSWMVFPPGVWMLVILAAAAAFMLQKTVFGRRVFAAGSNEVAARLCGIPVNRTKTLVYVIGGFFAGVAGLLQFSRLTVGDPTVAAGLELEVIAAVVIGGGSLAGGQGSIFGTLIGALIMATIRSGANQMGWPNWVQEIVTGGIIVVAVAADRIRHRH